MAGTDPQGVRIIHYPNGTIAVMDAVSMLTPGHGGAVVVGGSPCSGAAVAHTLTYKPAAVFLSNHGLADGGAAGLAAADAAGVPAAAVDAATAGSAQGEAAWSTGKLAAVNAAARRRGISAGMTVQQAAGLLLAWTRLM